MAISTNGTVLARLAGALYNTQMSNATYNEVKTLDPASLANALYARDFSSSTDLAVATTLVTNLGLSSITGLNNWVAAQLTAAGSGNKGAKIVDLLNGFAQMTADATYGSYATAFNASVDAALVLSQTTGNAGGTFAAAGSTGITFTLTTGVDSITGTAGGDTVTAILGTGATLTANDLIDLGASSGDVVNVRSDGAVTIPAITLSGVETLNISAPGAVTSDTTSSFITGLNTVNSTGVGAATVTGKATQALNVTTTGQAANAVSVQGGLNAVVTASGLTTGTTSVGGTTAVTGTATLTSNGVMANSADLTLGAITVKSTGPVVITQTSGAAAATKAATNYTVTGSAIGITGGAATTTITVTQDATVAVAAGTTSAGKVGVTAGAVTFTDANDGTSTADVLTSATLTNYGASTIKSAALNAITLAGTGASLALDRTTDDTTANATTLTINLAGGTHGSISGTHAADFTTVNVNATAASTISAATFAGATTLNSTGSATTTFTAQTLAALTTVNVTGAGGLSLGTALATGTTFNGGTGNDTVTLSNSFTKAITMGGGNDKVTVGGTTFGTGGSIAGGDGTDTIVMTGAQAATFSADNTFNSKVTGFEVLSLTTDAGTNVIDLTALNNISSVTAIGQTDVTINGMANGGTLTLTGGSTSETVNITGATGGVSDTLNLALNKASAGATAYGTVVAPNVETIAITSFDQVAAGSTAAVDTLTLTATAAKTITVAGNNGLTIAGGAALTSFNASGVVANGTADTAALLAVTFTSGNSTTAATITGGDGNDTLKGNVKVDTINGGAGIDTIYADNAGNKTAFASANVDVSGNPTGATTLNITFMGVSTGAKTFTQSTDPTAAEIVAGVKAVVAADPVLSKLIAVTGTSPALVFTSLVDGTTATLPTVVITPTGGAATYTAGNATAGTAGTTAADVVDGGAGADVVIGGGGADTLTGGAGADTFFFLKSHSTLASMATITDYTFVTSGTSNDKLILGDQTTIIGTTSTVQDLSSAVSLQAALDTAATTNVANVGLSVFIWGGNSYAYVETTGSGTSYVSTDFIVKLTGLPLAAGATIAGSGFDAV